MTNGILNGTTLLESSVKVMRFPPDSLTGKLLRKHGVSSRALSNTRVYRVKRLGVPALTVPLLLSKCIIFIRHTFLEMTPEGDIADGPTLAPLVHRFYHVHQRLEWGLTKYLWRHLKSRLYKRGVPLWHRDTERECYQAVDAVIGYYAPEKDSTKRTRRTSPI